MCEVPKGQIVRKQLPPEKVKELVTFSTKKPAERMDSIVDGLNMVRPAYIC